MNVVRLLGGWRRVAVATIGIASIVAAGQVAADAQVQAEVPGSHSRDEPLWGSELKDGFGHYAHPRGDNAKPAVAEEVCAHPQVDGVLYDVRWPDLETSEGVYDFSSLHEVIERVSTTDAGREKPCNVLFMVMWKTAFEFDPCPAYLSAQGLVSPTPNGGSTCHLWVDEVRDAYINMVEALGAEFDGVARVQGLRFHETSTSLRNNHPPSYTPEDYTEALTAIYESCSTSFATSWCLASINHIPQDNSLLHVIADDLQALPNGNACLMANDLKPSKKGTHNSANGFLQVLVDYDGCRAGNLAGSAYREPAAPDDYDVTPDTICAGPTPSGEPGCTMNDLFLFGARGTFGELDTNTVYDGGVCINGFLTWQYRTPEQPTPAGTFEDVLDTMADHPYGTDWTTRCAGGGPPLDYLSDVECDQTIVGTRFGAVTVSDGITCLADGSRVFGPITVNAGAGLVARNTSVTGPVTATGASMVVVVDSTVTGPVTISDTTGRVAVWDSTITGPITATNNTTADEPIIITGNHITGVLACTDNNPPPVSGAGSNTVTGPKTGQCADV